ncbi:potassium transporter TrkG [Shigella flexneri]
MGIVIGLAVAILPNSGRRGMQLYGQRCPPLKDNNAPAYCGNGGKTLWLIYVLLTVALRCTLWFAGMPAFDAIGHSFATIAMGGFSTHDASVSVTRQPDNQYRRCPFLLNLRL